MTAFYWPDTTPTVMSADGIVTHIYPTPDMKAALPRDWVTRAEAKGECIIVVTRAAVPALLKDVDAKAVADAKLSAATTDLSAPETGTAESKATAVQVKLATPIAVADYEKVLTLKAKVVAVEPIEKAAEAKL